MTRGGLFEGQWLHAAALALLLAAVVAALGWPAFAAGAFLGLTTADWVWLAVGNAVVQQLWVWLCWRAELHGQAMTRRIGARAFAVYAAPFFVMLALRPILAFALGWANRGTLPISLWAGIAVALVLLVPAAYLMHGIVHHFGFRRAAGADHFDPAYRGLPLVRAGILRWTPNAMYTFGFFILWVPAFLFQSVAALIVAALCHAYIWVHYFATERPDMRRLYG